jgi:hypothetical protein
MIGRQFPGKGKSDLYKVNSNGDQNLVTTYAILGYADIFAERLIKGKWQSEMGMREFGVKLLCHPIYRGKEHLRNSRVGKRKTTYKILERCGKY